MEGSGEGVASGGEADEGELVVAVAEDGVLRFERGAEVGEFFGEEFAVGIAGEFGAPETGELEGDLAAGLLPEEHVGWAGGEPEVAFGAVEPCAEVVAAGVVEPLGMERALVVEGEAIDIAGGYGVMVGEAEGDGDALEGCEGRCGNAIQLVMEEACLSGEGDGGARVDMLEVRELSLDSEGGDGVCFCEDDDGGEGDLFCEDDGGLLEGRVEEGRAEWGE